MHVVEIVFLMMREQVTFNVCYNKLHCVTCLICVQSASALARTGKGRSAEEKKRDEE